MKERVKEKLQKDRNFRKRLANIEYNLMKNQYVDLAPQYRILLLPQFHLRLALPKSARILSYILVVFNLIKPAKERG